MSILRRATEQRSVAQFSNYTTTPYASVFGQTAIGSAAGERVDELTALGLTAVMRCVTLLSDTVASLPLRAYRVSGGQRSTIDLPACLANPDVESNSFELIHSTMASLTLHGNAFIMIDRDARLNPIGLVPLHPYQMQVLPSADHVRRRYLHLGRDVPNENMLHIRWFTPPQSLVGVSPLVQSRTLVGLGLAMDRYLAQFYGEGATPSSVLESDRDLTVEQARALSASWDAAHRRHRRPAVLSGGLKWRAVQTSASDAQMAEMRDQVIRDVCRIYGVPGHLANAMGDNQTYQNVEQANLNFLTHTVTPWMRRLEIAFSKVLPRGTDVAFDTSGLLRTDALTRARVGQIQIMNGTRTPNELRQLDGLEPYEGGDRFTQVLPGAPVAPEGGLGTDDDTSVPVMGVIDA